MDIYEDDGARGILDIRKARRELEGSASINIEGVRRSIVAEISAAALLDIAYSLRPIGAEAADALNAQAMRTLESTEYADGYEEPAPVRELGVGDLVVVRGGDEPGEIIGLGYDQDSKYALVKFAESGDDRRVWIDLLELVDESEPGEDVRERILDAVAAETGELRADAAIVELPDGSAPPIVDGLYELTEDGGRELDEEDDLDRDFDTDTSGLAALVDDARVNLLALGALAEKAPAKKKGSKK